MIDTESCKNGTQNPMDLLHSFHSATLYDYSIISKPGDGIGTILITRLQTSFDIHFLPATRLCVYVCVCMCL